MEVFVRTKEYVQEYDFANVKPRDNKTKIIFQLRFKSDIFWQYYKKAVLMRSKKPHDAVVKFDTYRNVQQHRAVLPAIARLLLLWLYTLHLFVNKHCVFVRIFQMTTKLSW